MPSWYAVFHKKTGPFVIPSYVRFHSYELHEHFPKYIGRAGCCEYGINVCDLLTILCWCRYNDTTEKYYVNKHKTIEHQFTWQWNSETQMFKMSAVCSDTSMKVLRPLLPGLDSPLGWPCTNVRRGPQPPHRVGYCQCHTRWGRLPTLLRLNGGVQQY